MIFTKKLLISSITLTFLLVSCGEEEVVQEEILRPVKYEVVGESDLILKRSFSGVTKAGDEIELSFRANGIITELNAKVGKEVKKGDLLAKLDNVQSSLTYEQSKSSMRSAKSAMQTAKSALDRVKSLYEKGSSSLSEYEAAKNKYQLASDDYESAKKNVSIQSTQLSYGFIYAPADGVIASKSCEINENVSAGQIVLVLNAGDQMNVVIGLPENVINKIQLGMDAKVVFSSIGNTTITGSVIEIAPVLDKETSTYPVKLALGDSEDLKPGMSATVSFNFGDPKTDTPKKIIVPINAVGEDGKGNYVFIINPTKKGDTGTVKKQYVEIEQVTNSGFTISSGLDRGKMIATAGLQTLLDGQKVKL